VGIHGRAHTIAVECPDGKIMLGMMRSLDDITPANVTAALGGIDGYRAALAASDLVALVNWTMSPNMTAIFTAPDAITANSSAAARSSSGRVAM
jgi:hypothetical protein